MARIRGIEPPVIATTAVPVELLDHHSSIWSDPVQFAAWCVTTFGAEVPVDPGADVAFHRHLSAVEHWATLNGIVLPGPFGGADWNRLADLGVHRGRRLRAAACSIEQAAGPVD